MVNDIKNVTSLLRQKAEKLLKIKPNTSTHHSVADTLSLIHELEVHRIELEMQNDELELRNDELKEGKAVSIDSDELHKNYYDFAPLGYLSLTREGKIVDLNLNATTQLGIDRISILNKNFKYFISEESKPVFKNFLEKIFNSGLKGSCEVEITAHDSSDLYLHLTGLYSEKEELCYITATDITIQKQTDKYREMKREILQILNEPGEINDSIHRTVTILKTHTGFDAVGIRLQKGNDFPYCDQIGFPYEFVNHEISLKEYDKKGKVCQNKNGNPMLACTCGLVLSGKTSPKMNPLVTAGGSWWTNNSVPLSDHPFSYDGSFHPRNECIQYGYASMALVPIRNRTSIVGLIQFNDKRKDRFDATVIDVLEGIASHIGATLMRKQAEEELRQSEERYKSLFQNNHSMMMIIRPETGEIIDVNPAACQFYGWSHTELCHKNISEIDINTKSEIELLSNAKKGNNNHLILKHRLSNGLVKDVEVNSCPIQYGQSIMLYSIIHDITERKRAQEALQLNEERYSLIYNSSRDSVFSFDLDGKFTSANRSFCKEVKLELIQIVDHTFAEIGIPEYLRIELEKLTQQVKETDTSSISELKVPITDGSVRFYELILNPLHDEKTTIVGIGGSARNITKRKENYKALRDSEKMFRYLVKDLTVGVILYGQVEQVVMCNPKALELFGVNESQLKNQTYDMAWNSVREDGSMILSSEFPVRLAFENGHSVRDVIIGVRSQSDSDITWLLVNAEVILKDDRSIRNVVCSFIDITRLKKAENDLRENEQRLKYHFENSPLAVVEWDKDFIVTQWSLEAEHIFGWNKKETLGKKIDTLNLIYEEDIPFVYHTMEKLTTGKKDTFISSNRNVTKSGKLIDCTWYNSILLDQNGETSSVMSLVQDITLRKQAEDALRQLNEALEDRVSERTAELLKSNETIKLAEEKYRTVSEFAFNWEYWIDPIDRMVYCSPSCESITGYQSTEFEQNSDLMIEIVHPNDLQSFQEHKTKEFRNHACDHEFQYRIIKKDGSIRWIGHFSRPVYDEFGNFRGIRGSNKDITARKKMEELLTTSNEKYRLLSENITDGIFICKNGKFEYMNKAIYSIFGYEGREMERMKLTQLVMTDFHEELENFLYTNWSENQSCNIELECLKKDFTLVFVEILLNYTSMDKLVYGVVHDITEKKLLQKKMVKAIIQTEEKERAHFSKELHDGLGPLLSTIKLYLQWSERPNSNRSHTEIIGKAGEILEEALTTVKEISNRLSPHLLTNYGLSSAINSFVDKLNETSSLSVVFETNMDRRIDIEIEAALYRAIIECINNTLKYAHANNIYINLIESGEQIQIIYQDDGKGFDVTETLTKHKGLGLFNLMNRLNTIGGKVDLYSEPGKGVNYLFTVNL